MPNTCEVPMEEDGISIQDVLTDEPIYGDGEHSPDGGIVEIVEQGEEAVRVETEEDVVMEQARQKGLETVCQDVGDQEAEVDNTKQLEIPEEKVSYDDNNVQELLLT